MDKLKSALRERNKELQKFEQERRNHEKEKVDASLKIKELEHKIAKFHKDSRDAAQRVNIILNTVCGKDREGEIIGCEHSLATSNYPWYSWYSGFSPGRY